MRKNTNFSPNQTIRISINKVLFYTPRYLTRRKQLDEIHYFWSFTKTMNKNIIATFFALFISVFATLSSVAKEDDDAPKFSYFTLDPEITTNFITDGRKLGFINVQVDLMVDDPSLLPILKYHQPLIRDTMIEMLNQESEMRIKSLAGREAIRKASLEKVNEILLIETNQKVLSDLLFTKYLYQ